MYQYLQNIVTHLDENKKVYIAAGIGVAIGATAVLLTRTTSGAQVAQKVTQIGFRNEANPTIINLIERSTPSKAVHLVGTNLYFNSLSEAARETGHKLSTISKHVNGLIPDVKGDVFQLLEPAA